jgi:hypothetical protein
MLYHFKKPIPDGLRVKQDVSFADVQTDVMSGLSYDDIVSKYMIIDMYKS